jgi:hypothetical protein
MSGPAPLQVIQAAGIVTAAKMLRIISRAKDRQQVSPADIKRSLHQVADLLARGEEWILPLYLRLESERDRADEKTSAIARARKIINDEANFCEIHAPHHAK